LCNKIKSLSFTIVRSTVGKQISNKENLLRRNSSKCAPQQVKTLAVNFDGLEDCEAQIGNKPTADSPTSMATTDETQKPEIEEEKYFQNGHPQWDVNTELVDRETLIPYQSSAYQPTTPSPQFHSYWSQDSSIFNHGTSARPSLTGNQNKDSFSCLPLAIPFEEGGDLEDKQLYAKALGEYEDMARETAKAQFERGHYGMGEGPVGMYESGGTSEYQEINSDTFSVSSVFSEPIAWKSTFSKASDEAQGRNHACVDYNLLDDSKDGSFLFVTFTQRVDNPEQELKRILREREFTVLDVRRTKDTDVFFVLFDKHSTAKRAFTSQRDIQLRMVPPKKSKKNWFKNPAPNFHVQFETKRRLTVKKGKSTTKTNVGELLMKDAKHNQGCKIWADQLKGQRLRIVGYVGRLMLPDGSIVENTEPPSKTNKSVVGWISTRCNLTRTDFVERKSGITLREYYYP